MFPRWRSSFSLSPRAASIVLLIKKKLRKLAAYVMSRPGKKAGALQSAGIDPRLAPPRSLCPGSDAPGPRDEGVHSHLEKSPRRADDFIYCTRFRRER